MNGYLIDIQESKLWRERFFSKLCYNFAIRGGFLPSLFSGIKKRNCSVCCIAIYMLALDFQEDKKSVSISTKTKERLSP